MNKAFEKILERLEESQTIEFNLDGKKPKQTIDFSKAVEIVQEVAEEYNDGWIPCSERLPNKEECLKNDNRFIVTDGNRSYQRYFDCKEQQFVEHMWRNTFNTYIDRCVTYWQPLPEPYNPKVCNTSDCHYNTGKDCPAADGCAGYEQKGE